MKASGERNDRQIRIWGSDGQAKLYQSKIICLGIGSAGAEAMKNLILPGVGHVILVSDKKVTQRDLSKNFYIRPEAVDQNKLLAEECLENLLELNPEVEGRFIEADPETFQDTHRQDLDACNLIIADQLSWKTCINLDNYVRGHSAKKNLIVMTNCGLLGMIRLCCVEYTSYQTKPDAKKLDLRINEPWPELVDFVDGLDIPNMEEAAHRLTPFIAVQIHLMKEWKSTHNGNFPQNSKEKNEFREIVKSGAKFGGFNNEENYEEAYKYANNAFNDPKEIPDDVQMAFDVCTEKDDLKDSLKNDFYFLVKSQKKFFEQEGRFPVSGEIPDCHSDTKTYLLLKKIFKDKAQQDLVIFKEILEKTIHNGNVICMGEPPKVPEEMISEFCKNWRTIACVKFRSLQEQTQDVNREEFQWDGDDMHGWYFCLQALDKFKQANNRHPNPEDFTQLRQLVDDLLTEQQMDKDAFVIDDDKVKEICRYEDSELITTCSILGGVASQEAIKLLTEQFEPVNNTWLFEGIESRAISCEF